MKKILFMACLISISACSPSQSKYEKTIVDFLNKNAEIKADLEIKFKSFEVSDYFVSDSIQVLKERDEKERNRKIEVIQKKIDVLNTSIARQEKEIQTSTFKPVQEGLIRKYSKEKQEAEKNLREAQSWVLPGLHKYDNRSPSELLAKKVLAKFNYFDPKLHVKQDMNAIFILSPDGNTCHRMMRP